MEESIYFLTDGDICRKIGAKLRSLRLRQNFTQMALAEQAQISVSTVKKVETGEIGSFDSLLRIMRVLGELDIISPLLKENEMSPNEYLAYVEASKRKQRQRASSSSNNSSKTHIPESEW